jgi:putative Mn2+ efflux pump MntP
MFKTSLLLGANAFMLAFAAGAMDKSVFWTIIFIMFATFLMSVIGFALGKPESKSIMSKKAEAVAGIVIIILAIRMLLYYSA